MKSSIMTLKERMDFLGTVASKTLNIQGRMLFYQGFYFNTAYRLKNNHTATHEAIDLNERHLSKLISGYSK